MKKSLILLLVIAGCDSRRNDNGFQRLPLVDPVSLHIQSEFRLVEAPHSTLSQDEECATFFSSSELRKMEKKYSKLSTLAFSFWDKYRPEEQSVVFTNSEGFSKCAVVINNGKRVGDLTLTSPIEFQNGFYNFYLATSSSPLPQDLRNFLSEKNVKRAGIFNLAKMDLPATDYELFLEGMSDFDLNIVVHEGFHLNLMIAKLVP